MACPVPGQRTGHRLCEHVPSNRSYADHDVYCVGQVTMYLEGRACRSARGIGHRAVKCVCARGMWHGAVGQCVCVCI